MMEKIKKIREKTGAGVVDIKKALEEAEGDEKKALEILRNKGLEKADKKGDRETKEGTIGFYVHTTGKIASWIKVYCETDFVAKNEEFRQLAKDLAMQVAAMPLAKKEDFLKQPFIKSQETTVEDYVKEKIAKIGENIQVGEFGKVEL